MQNEFSSDTAKLDIQFLIVLKNIVWNINKRRRFVEVKCLRYSPKYAIPRFRVMVMDAKDTSRAALRQVSEISVLTLSNSRNIPSARYKEANWLKILLFQIHIGHSWRKSEILLERPWK